MRLEAQLERSRRAAAERCSATAPARIQPARPGGPTRTCRSQARRCVRSGSGGVKRTMGVSNERAGRRRAGALRFKLFTSNGTDRHTGILTPFLRPEYSERREKARREEEAAGSFRYLPLRGKARRHRRGVLGGWGLVRTQRELAPPLTRHHGVRTATPRRDQPKA